MQQIDLAAVLSLIRTQGAGVFYAGPLARRIAEATQLSGGKLTVDDMRQFLPRWREPISIPFGNDIVSFAPPPAGVGIAAAQMWQMLTIDDRYVTTSDEERPHLLIEVSKRAFIERTRWLAENSNFKFSSPKLVSSESAAQLMLTYQPDSPTQIGNLNPQRRVLGEKEAGTSFVVVDNKGQAVACTLTMYDLFGNGNIAPGTGIVLAASQNKSGQNPLSLGPMMISNQHVKAFKLAIAGSGGAPVSTSVIAVAMSAVVDQLPLEEAINLPRAHHGGLPDFILAEVHEDNEVIQNLRRRGHKVRERESLGRLNAVYCPSGLPGVNTDRLCAVAHDFRGSGMVAKAED